MRLQCERRLADVSYLGRIYPSERDRQHHSNGVVIRVIDSRLEGEAVAKPIQRRVTTPLEHEPAPTVEVELLEEWPIPCENR